MQNNKNFLDYPAADEFYTSEAFEGSAGSGVVVKNTRTRLVYLYIFNKNAATRYVSVEDFAPGNLVAGVPYPIPAGGYISLAFVGGKRFTVGINLQFYSDAGLSNEVNVDDFWIDAGMVAYA